MDHYTVDQEQIGFEAVLNAFSDSLARAPQTPASTTATSDDDYDTEYSGNGPIVPSFSPSSAAFENVPFAETSGTKRQSTSLKPTSKAEYIKTMPNISQVRKLCSLLEDGRISADSVVTLDVAQFGLPLSITAAELRDIFDVESSSDLATNRFFPDDVVSENCSSTEFERISQNLSTNDDSQKGILVHKKRLAIGAISLGTAVLLVVSILIVCLLNKSVDGSSDASDQNATFSPIVLIGGDWMESFDFGPLNSTEFFITGSANKTLPVGPLNEGRSGHVGAVLNSTFIVAGGMGRSYVNGSINVLKSIEFYYDNQWKFAETELIQERVHAAAALIDNRLCICGGMTTSDENLTSSCECIDGQYNPHPMASMEVARFGAASAIVDGKMYVVGGQGRAETALNTIEMFDQSLDKWQLLESTLPVPRRFLASTVTANNEVLVCGGTGLDWTVIGSQCFIFNTVALDWRQANSMNDARFGFGLVADASRIFALGGAGVKRQAGESDCCFKSIEMIDFEKEFNQWTIVNQSLITARSHFFTTTIY